MSATLRVMLLIDADNVSTDVVEQAVSRLHAEYGALHVRRAYGTAEAAVKHQRLFKRLSIRPMVNLAAGKNSTDIALAVDALDLVYCERPDVVVIASSDSDFAPLVARIREKGCLVRGVGQKGKVGEETPLVYDDFIEFEHRKTRGRAAAAVEPAAAAPRKTRARKSAEPASDEAATAEAASAAAAPAVPAAKTAASAKTPRKTAARKTGAKAKAGHPVDDADATDAAAGPAPTPTKAAARKPAAGKSAARKRAVSRADAAPVVAPAAEAASAAGPGAPPMPDKVARAFAALPQLASGQPMDVQAAASVLRREHVFSNADSWPKFFARHADWFELTPAGRPTQVRRRLA